MDSVGEILREARELKGITVEQAAQETHISRHYIEALEKEDFSQFPGETYIYGFLRNYADHLGLDPEKVIDLYRNFKVREQPVPMDELLGKNKKSPLAAVVKIVISLALLTALGLFIVPRVIHRFTEMQETRRQELAAQQAQRDIQVYAVSQEVMENRLYLGDKLTVDLDGEIVPVELTAIGKELTLSWKGGELSMALGEEHYIDLNNDDVLDLRVALRDIDLQSAEGGVLLMSHLMDQDAPESGSPNIDSMVVSGELSEGYVIMEDIRPQPFRLDAVFRGYCLMRYRSDGREVQQDYFREGDRFRLEVNRSVQLGVSNAASLIVKIGGRELDLGGGGKVAVKLIRWESNEETGRYQLKAREIY